MATIGKFKPGDKVSLREHQELPGKPPASKYWISNMYKYVGKETTIVSCIGNDPYGIITYAVAIDNSTHAWREVNLIHVDNMIGVVSSILNKNGANCFKCKEHYPYANYTENFVCWSCKK